MIKMLLSFVLGVVALGWCVLWPFGDAAALSSHVMITRIQAGGVGAATQEYVAVYNNTPDEVEITGWCLTNKGSFKIACFDPPVIGQKMYLPAYSYATVASELYAASFLAKQFTYVYSPLNQSSGSITGSSDAISLLNSAGEVVDRYAWSVSAPSGMHLSRSGVGDPKVYVDTDTVLDWMVISSQPIPDDETIIDESILDVCPNLEGLQVIVPPGFIVNEIGECVVEVLALLDITEILPNPKGSDAGLEFIELYNSNDFTVYLSDYQLRIGPQLDMVFDFPAGAFIEPKGYKSFSNADIPFSLLNTSSRVRLVHINGSTISDTPVYESPKDGQSWMYVDGEWMYSASPTPGIENSKVGEPEEVPTVTTLQPCAANQYRSPETGRCRLLASVTGVVTPCKDGQYRSEETNRCRAITSDTRVVAPCDEGSERNPDTGRCRKIAAVTGPVPCKAGQERSAETNRCRTVTKMQAADYGVLGAKTDGGGNWYVVAAIGGVLLLAVAYAIWEWRDEIGKCAHRVFLLMNRFVRVRK